jgi:molecular chaperone GrpE
LSEHHDGDGPPPGAPQDPQDGPAQPQQAQPEQPPPSREELERKVTQLSAMLEDSTSRARETQERLKDTHERLLRVAAEFDNFKKRATKEREDAQKFGI